MFVALYTQTDSACQLTSILQGAIRLPLFITLIALPAQPHGSGRLYGYDTPHKKPIPPVAVFSVGSNTAALGAYKDQVTSVVGSQSQLVALGSSKTTTLAVLGLPRSSVRYKSSY